MRNLSLFVIVLVYSFSSAQCPFTTNENWGGGGANCACSWTDGNGDANCAWGNCSAGNQSTCQNDCDGTYYFQHSDPIALCTSIILPIRLVNFEGKVRELYNEITWVTGAEINNNYFIIYNSTNGEDWIEVSTLPGAGNSSENKNYNLFHYN